ARCGRARHAARGGGGAAARRARAPPRRQGRGQPLLRRGDHALAHRGGLPGRERRPSEAHPPARGDPHPGLGAGGDRGAARPARAAGQACGAGRRRARPPVPPRPAGARPRRRGHRPRARAGRAREPRHLPPEKPAGERRVPLRREPDAGGRLRGPAPEAAPPAPRAGGARARGGAGRGGARALGAARAPLRAQRQPREGAGGAPPRCRGRGGPALLPHGGRLLSPALGAGRGGRGRPDRAPGGARGDQRARAPERRVRLAPAGGGGARRTPLSAPNRTVQAGSAGTLSQILFLRGEYAEALRWADECLEGNEAIGNVSGFTAPAAVALAARVTLGLAADTERYLELIEQGLASGRTVQANFRFVADALLALCEVERAERFMEELRARPNSSGRLREAYLETAVGEVMLGLG